MSILGAFGLTYPQKKTLSPLPSISLFLLSPLLPLLIKPVPCLSSPRFPRQVTSLLTTMELAIQTTGRHLLSRTTALFSLAAILGFLILVLETALVILILGLVYLILLICRDTFIRLITALNLVLWRIVTPTLVLQRISPLTLVLRRITVSILVPQRIAALTRRPQRIDALAPI